MMKIIYCLLTECLLSGEVGTITIGEDEVSAQLNRCLRLKWHSKFCEGTVVNASTVADIIESGAKRHSAKTTGKEKVNVQVYEWLVEL